MSPPLFPLYMALYAVAGTLYCVAVAQPSTEFAPKVARWVLLLALVCQGIDIGWLCLHGKSPSTEAREAVFFASWAMIAAFAASTLKTHLPVVGLLVLPVSLILNLASRLAPASMQRTVSTLRTLHILCATVGVAIFAVAAGAGVIYVLTERQFKRHSLGQLGKRGPALFTLDTLNRRAILLGFPVFTIAIVSGTVFFVERLGKSGSGAAVLLFTDPRYALAVLTWVLFAILLVARAAYGLRGRRAALLTVYGFLGALSVLGIYLLRAMTLSTPPGV